MSRIEIELVEAKMQVWSFRWKCLHIAVLPAKKNIPYLWIADFWGCYLGPEYDGVPVLRITFNRLLLHLLKYHFIRHNTLDWKCICISVSVDIKRPHDTRHPKIHQDILKSQIRPMSNLACSCAVWSRDCVERFEIESMKGRVHEKSYKLKRKKKNLFNLQST